MKWIAIGLMAAALLAPTTTVAREHHEMGERHEGFHRFHDRGDFRFRDHDRFRNRFFFGGDFFAPGPYPYSYYPQSWYWCGAPAGYYPYVQQCAVPWQAVPAY